MAGSYNGGYDDDDDNGDGDVNGFINKHKGLPLKLIGEREKTIAYLRNVCL